MTAVLPLIRRELAALARRRGEFPVRTVGLAILLLVTMGSLLLYVAGIPFLAVLTSVGRGGESIFYLNPVFWFVMSLEYREGHTPGGPIGSVASFFGGYIFFVLCCVALAALFRYYAAMCLRGGTKSAPVPPGIVRALLGNP